MLSPSTVTILSFMVVWAIYVIFKVYLKIHKAKSFANINVHIFESIPTVFTTLGILGTFIGIFIGLINFHVDDVDGSIPKLLEGLKTAFFTSIVGIFLSLLSSKYNEFISGKIEKDSPPIYSNELTVLHEIRDSLSTSQSEINKTLETINSSLVSETDHSLGTQLIKTRNQLSELKISVGHNSEQLKNIFDALGGGDESSLINQIKGLREEQSEQSTNSFTQIKVISKTLDENNAFAKSSLESTTNQLNAVINALSGSDENSLSSQLEILRNEQAEQSSLSINQLMDVNKKMTENSNIVQQKFDEFSELLAKNNTEALVEVMKRATEEFNAQMSALIEKLVQENFEELNRSVERLNSWQQENKEMISKLTNEFKTVSSEFGVTSEQLRGVTENTGKLTDDNSHLKQLILALQQVMIEDTKYQEITNKLTSTVDIVQSNIEAFDTTTNKLNKWVQNQQEFSISVEKLLVRLEQIDKIKDINEVFWKDTKKQLDEGVNIISNANRKLNNDLDAINDQFYERLNSTLQNLDVLIVSVMEKYKS